MVGARRPTEASGKSFLNEHERGKTLIRISCLKFAIAASVIGGLVRQGVVLTTTFMAILAVTFPRSETSLGGNYNLHYLPALFRREMRPQIGPYSPGVAEVAGRPFPAYSLIPDAPISLYIPFAGFLWSDSLTWDTNRHSFQWKDEIRAFPKQPSTADALEDQIDHLNNNQSRVIFSDSFNTVGPWFFQHVLSDEDDPADPVLAARVWPGQAVYLRQVETGEFVTPSIDGITISDMYDNVLDGEVRRLHITADEHESPTSKWQVIYDAHHDHGFRLWNEAANCFLATSYRTYPNMHGRESNDTILETLHLELEACCTYPASHAASTFYAVDGVRKPPAPSTWLPPSTGQLAMYESQLRARGSNTIDLLRAMWMLYLSREHYARLQDMASDQAKLHVGIPYPTHWSRVFHTIIAGSVLLHLGKAMYARRLRAPGVRKPATYRSGSMLLLQLCYLVYYMVGTLQRGNEVWDSHFAVGVAWITVVDFVDHVGCMGVNFGS
ncbi:hypothetical protein N7457_002738 [Penicillium paradoxum]|uniref:uncharacterized protein n=1 Tax=Penicillium paradoxum TaxID=176176 RepID=UPI0025485DB3|nr:uncharacterized protein N7457_002738 [Penicillium paradoxum]KAJ5787748.1 hypothetical protein N7457_002738 [Penicillium paradoxum]